MNPVLPSINDAAESPLEKIESLEPPPGYEYGAGLQLRPIPGVNDLPTEEGDRAPTARDQVMAAIKTLKGLDAFDIQLRDLPLRMCLTAEDFGLDADFRGTAMAALSGDQESFQKCVRAFELFILLMDQDYHRIVKNGLDGLPYRTLLRVDPKSGRSEYTQPIYMTVKRWDITPYDAFGVKSGMAPLPGFYHELVRAGWLTHLLPNMIFAYQPDDLPGAVATERGKTRAARRLDPTKNVRRRRSLEWLEKAKEFVEAKMPKAAKKTLPPERGGKFRIADSKEAE